VTPSRTMGLMTAVRGAVVNDRGIVVSRVVVPFYVSKLAVDLPSARFADYLLADACWRLRRHRSKLIPRLTHGRALRGAYFHDRPAILVGGSAAEAHAFAAGDGAAVGVVG
jgi:hypothetical protein